MLNDLARMEDPTFDVRGHHQVAFRDDIRTGKVGVLLERLDPYLQPSDHSVRASTTRTWHPDIGEPRASALTDPESTAQTPPPGTSVTPWVRRLN